MSSSFPMGSLNVNQVIDAPIEEMVRHFPSILERLRDSYEELEQRAGRVERELYSTNRELEARLAELDGLRSHLEAVLESLPCGVVVRDAAGRVVKVNAAAQELLCLTAGASAGDELQEALKSHDALQGCEADGKPHEVESLDGRRIVLASSYSPVRRGDGHVDGSVEILDDQTERTEMAERLHASDKMAALGTMAAGIAHEIRNPMNAIKGFASLLARREDFDEKTKRWCQLIVDATSEADSIIENMLTFGSPERLRLETIDPAELLESATLQAGIRPQDDEVDVRHRVDAPPFGGDLIKLRQALRNLIANAVAAQRSVGLACPRVDLAIARSEDTIEVAVDDAGPGISEAIRSRIFDPFFTDHADGTGLGLALVSTIVRLHGGSVRLSPEASPLGGARFLIRLPFSAAEPRPTTSPAL